MLIRTVAVLTTLALAAPILAQPRKTVEPPPAGEPGGFAVANFWVRQTTPAALRYLEQPSVRAELKLGKDQAAKIDVIRSRWADAAARQNLEGTDRGAPADLMADTRKKLDETLTAAQAKRLKQVILRHREREHGLPAVVASLAGELNLSPEQQQKYEALRLKRAEAVLEHITSGERAGVVARSIAAANRDYLEQVERLLGKEQRQKLADLLGEPFDGAIKLGDPAVVATGRPRDMVYLGSLYNCYALEPALLATEAVQKELKLDNDQVRKVKELYVDWSEQLAAKRKVLSAAVAVETCHELVRNRLTGLLTPAQERRFRSIAMQYRANHGGIAAACGHPEANEILKITSRQDASLRDGIAPADVLNLNQQVEFTNLFGQPFKGELKFDNPLVVAATGGVARPARGVPLPEARQPFAGYMVEQSRRLRLTEEQVDRLKQIADDTPKLRALLHKELAQLPAPTVAGAARTFLPETRAAEIFRKAVREQCIDVLDEKQKSLFGGELRNAAGHFLD